MYKYDKFGKGLPIYHIKRFVTETLEEVDDGSNIIYVNGKYKGDNPIGRLISDFHEPHSDKMHYSELADSIKHFKETEEGRDSMCDLVEQYVNQKAEEKAKEIAEGMAKDMAEVMAEEEKEKQKEKTIEARIGIISNLMKNLKMTLSEAMDAAGLLGEERTAVEARLS